MRIKKQRSRALIFLLRPFDEGKLSRRTWKVQFSVAHVTSNRWLAKSSWPNWENFFYFCMSRIKISSKWEKNKNVDFFPLRRTVSGGVCLISNMQPVLQQQRLVWCSYRSWPYSRDAPSPCALGPVISLPFFNPIPHFPRHLWVSKGRWIIWNNKYYDSHERGFPHFCLHLLLNDPRISLHKFITLITKLAAKFLIFFKPPEIY